MKEIFSRTEYEARLLLNNAATKEKFIQNISSCSVLHLACHADMSKSENEILPGALLLSSSNGKDNGRVLSKEIQKLNLDGLELAFLNCCETGSGELYREGLIGLDRAFLFAGVKSVILSLLNVVDQEETCLLVSKFYNLFLQGIEPEGALRNAQIFMYQNGYDEKFWAPYFVMKSTL